MSMSVLITGAAGYLGAPVCLELLAAGARVRGLDVLLHGQQQVADELAGAGVDLMIADVRDPAARAQACAGVDAVVHLAAVVGDPACARDPSLAYEVNVEASTGLIDDARRAQVVRFVFA